VHAEPAQPVASTLSTYFNAFAQKRLLTQHTAEVSELRAQLATAEQWAQDGRDEDAVLLLFDITRHPRFAAYTDLEELSAAHYALGSSLHTLGAEPSARAELRKVLDKGPDERYFAPAYRRYVDVVLALGATPALLEELKVYTEKLPADARDEHAYVVARERLNAGDAAAAKLHFERISTRSRFYANAQYELGALAAKERAFPRAEERFCRIASAGDDRRYAFYVDGRYFHVKDLARLGLGRVAHEQGRGDDAFYYYFQVPNDSQRMPEALFEAAYARYEAKDSDGAADLLDQLEARFPKSTFTDEASVLRGYVALSQCDYEAANKHFARFNAHFTPVLQHIDRLLQNPERRAALYETLRAPSDAPASEQPSKVHSSLLTLLRVDPEFDALHAAVVQLDREAARAGRVPESYDLLIARYNGGDRPRAAVDEQDKTAARELEALRQQFADARRGLRVLHEQLDAMRALGAREGQLATEERTLAELAKRQRTLEVTLNKWERAKAERSARAHAPATTDTDSSQDVAKLLWGDLTRAHTFDDRLLQLRPTLVQAANERAFAELKALRGRLAGFLRRSRIGRIDAVMGSKRRIEHQIESLSAGRVPRELQDPMRVQGFLDDDEEYWPFEGEDWPDEFLETGPAISVPTSGAAR
jgi:outer membrane protein assembly factor BamD (BamD/ComL family)